jgi:hypothetical protein
VDYLWDEKAQELREAVQRAYEAYNLAAEKCKATITEGPHALPRLDGEGRIANAAREERHALDEYVKAIRAFKDCAKRRT